MWLTINAEKGQYLGSLLGSVKSWNPYVRAMRIRFHRHVCMCVLIISHFTILIQQIMYENGVKLS